MKSIKQIFLVLIISLCFIAPAFSQSATAQIDKAISKNDSKKVEKILLENKKADNYSQLEAYILKKAEELAAKGKLEMALAITLSVVDNNIDNFQALELYTSLEEEMKKKGSSEKTKADKKDSEEAKKALAEKKKSESRKQNASVVVENSQTGQVVYIDQDFNNHYSMISWKTAIGLFDFNNAFATEVYELKYGVSMDANVFYHGDYVIAGLEAFADVGILNFVDSALKDYLFDCRAGFGIGTPFFTEIFFLTAGYMYSDVFGDQVNYVTLPFHSPYLGLAFRDIHIGRVYFDASLDYYLSTIWDERVTAAGEIALNFFFSFVDLGKADLGLNLAVRDSLYVIPESGIQNQTKIIVGVEVFSNE
ncbi:MAG: hypothetical protein K5839_05140 [Treponemataceae bacterium]|nr:hypothetical protein [Treponemataceae bacterium]